MGDTPSKFQGNGVAESDPQTHRVVKEVESPNHPVEQASWDDAVEFCERLSELPQKKKARRVYRLPTEAEWEHGCRAGIKPAYSFGDDPNSLADWD
jgi:formylglycine-generating enzyme required for sulfatase activity